MEKETELTVKAIQKKQLELLKELDRVCKILSIDYWLASGTCLGAVRHNGFIPWDDDIDVYMLWNDAEKLADNQEQFKEQFFVQCKKTDPEIRSTHYRLRDSTTTCFLEEDVGLDVNHGLFIDIYILYPYPDSTIKALKTNADSFLYRILQAREGPRNHGNGARFIGNLLLRLYSEKGRIRKINKIEKEYTENGGMQYYATYFGRDVKLIHSIVYPQSWFHEPAKMQFEDMTVLCPGNPEEYCKLQYGDTFMILPPESAREPHHEFVHLDLSKPYTDYKGIYY